MSERLQQVQGLALYRDIAAIWNRLAGLQPLEADLETFVTDRALDGLFSVIAAEEQRIRNDPVARTTELLREVFGSRGTTRTPTNIPAECSFSQGSHTQTGTENQDTHDLSSEIQLSWSQGKNQDIYGRLRSVNLMSDTVRGHIFGVIVAIIRTRTPTIFANQDTHDFPG